MSYLLNTFSRFTEPDRRGSNPGRHSFLGPLILALDLRKRFLWLWIFIPWIHSVYYG